MPKIINAFPLTVFQDSVTMDPAYRAELCQAILAMESQKIQQTPGSSWTGDTNGREFLHNDPRFDKLFASFSEPLARYLEMLRIDLDKITLYYTRSWGTVSVRGQAIQPHNHVQAHLSLVYYLQKPADSSGISFTENDVPNQFAPNLFRESMLEAGVLKEIQQLNARTINLNPGQDDLLIFPSKAFHTVTPNSSTTPRISIAVDLLTTVKDPTGLEYVLPEPDTWKAVS